MQRQRARTRATILGIAAILLWSTTIGLARSVTEQLGPLTSAALIYLLGGALGCAYLAATGGLAKLPALGRRYLLGCGGLFTIYMVCLYLAIGLVENRAQTLAVGLLNYLWPMLTLLVSVPILNLKATSLLLPGSLVATFGAFLAMTQGQSLSWAAVQQTLTHNAAPYALAAGAALSWALYSALSRRWARDDGGVTAVPVFMLVTGIVLGLARVLAAEETVWTSRALCELLYMAIGPNLAYLFWERAMQRGDIVLVISCSYFTPLLSTLISSAYLGVRTDLRLWIGCALIIVGAATCRRSVRDPASDPQ